MEYSTFGIIIGLSILSGIAIGWNRRCKGAGARDFSLIIVSISVITYVMTSAFQGNALEGLSNLIVAMGFIAAGILFNQQKAVLGITTGLSIFTGAVIGVIYGLEKYYFGIALTAVTIIILFLNQAHKTCE